MGRIWSRVQEGLSSLLSHTDSDTNLDDLEDAPRRRPAGRSVKSRSTSPPSGRRGAQRRQSEARRPAPPLPEHRLALLYETLETPFGADLLTIKRSFRRLMRLYHPDLRKDAPAPGADDTGKVRRIISAYEELTSALSRRA